MYGDRFEEKIVLVIGAGAGMGEATALQFLNEGAKVIGLDLYKDRLESLEKQSVGLKGTLDTYLGDIAEESTVEEIIAFITEKYGSLDIIAHVAGIMDFMMPPDILTDKMWDRVMAINVKSVWRMAKAAMPLLKNHEDNGACVTIVSSLGGYAGSSAGPAYIASKHAVEGLMKNLAFSYRENKVRFNCVAPGAVITEICDTSTRMFPEYEDDWASGLCDEGVELYMEKGILGIRPEEAIGVAEDIANAITFLSSDQARFINGASLIVDGGWYSA